MTNLQSWITFITLIFAINIRFDMEPEDFQKLTIEKIRSIFGVTPGFLFQLLGMFWIIAPIIVYFDTAVFSFFTYLSMILMGLCGIVCIVLCIPNIISFSRSLKEFTDLSKLPMEERQERAKILLQQKESQWVTNSMIPTLITWLIGISGIVILILDYNAII